MSREEMLKDLEKMTIGVDDTFRFHCTQCGKCCINREDIILSPMDLFRMAKELQMNVMEICLKYCRSHIGDTSRMPIIMLQPVGHDNRCPLLKNNLCSVHKAKPAVCALFPLGRYLSFPAGEFTKEVAAKTAVKYLLQPIDCGDDSEVHTVREWIGGFDSIKEDDAYRLWNQAILEVSNKIKELEKTADMITMAEVWFVVRSMLYLKYNTSMEFHPQLEENVQLLMKLLNNIPLLKGLVNGAARGT